MLLYITLRTQAGSRWRLDMIRVLPVLTPYISTPAHTIRVAKPVLPTQLAHQNMQKLPAGPTWPARPTRPTRPTRLASPARSVGLVGLVGLVRLVALVGLVNILVGLVGLVGLTWSHLAQREPQGTSEPGRLSTSKPQ
jgi:hypothetical protein